MKKFSLHALLQNKVVAVLIALFLLGLFLVIASSGFGSGQEKERAAQAPEPFDEAGYTKALEARLSEHLSAISGAGSVRVMVTLDTTIAQNYSRDTVSEHTVSEGSDNGRDAVSLVLQSEKNGVKSPVLESESLPRVRGVCVVASGAQTPAVKLKLTEALQALLAIRANQVSVTA